MVIKFLKAPKEGSGVGSIYYLLNPKRVNTGTAKILEGNKKETIELINALDFKHKATFGVLSFLEKDITDAQKREIMAEFEATIFAGLEKNKNYKILWVQHTDKERLELNFVIPKVELQSGKSLNTYYHKAHQSGINALQEYINLKYNLATPKDPARENTIQFTNKKQKQVFKDLNELKDILQNAVAKGILTSRTEIIAYLENADIEVTRQTKNFISVKLNGKKSRLVGGIFNAEFRELGDLAEIAKDKRAEIRAYNKQDFGETIKKYYRELESFREYRARENTKRYGTGRTEPKGDEPKTRAEPEPVFSQNGTDGARAERVLENTKEQDRTDEIKSSGELRSGENRAVTDPNGVLTGKKLRPSFSWRVFNRGSTGRIFNTQHNFRLEKQAKERAKNERKRRILRNLAENNRRAETNARAELQRNVRVAKKRIREISNEIYERSGVRTRKNEHFFDATTNIYNKLGRSFGELNKRLREFADHTKQNISGVADWSRKRRYGLLETNKENNTALGECLKGVRAVFKAGIVGIAKAINKRVEKHNKIVQEIREKEYKKEFYEHQDELDQMVEAYNRKIAEESGWIPKKPKEQPKKETYTPPKPKPRRPKM